tara:strand:+ start:140 stop:388 length:249 start_codon:yes stop_codon:yes gene_type:complete
MKQLLTTKQAAEFLNVSTYTLERDRWAGARIPFIKVGPRSVRYTEEDLIKYIESKRRVSTTDDVDREVDYLNSEVTTGGSDA